MPPKKASNPRMQNKTEIAEKVKEIKQRQKNWLKQRDEQIDTTDTSPPTKSGIDTKYNRSDGKSTTTYPKPTTATNTHHQSERTYVKNGGQGDSRTLPMHAKHKTSKFNTWMKAREKHSEADSEIANPDIPEHSSVGASYTISKEKTYSVNRPLTDRISQEITQDYNQSSLQSSIPASDSLSADAFDQLADQIVNRVRNELDLKGRPYYANQYADSQSTSYQKSSTINSNAKQTPVNTSRSSPDKTAPSPDNPGSSLSGGSSSRQDNTYLEGHYCPQCSQLMVGKQDPMLIIPCGHNICKSCSEQEDVDLCSVCSCEISSFTSNIMLKQIIIDHKRDRRRKDGSQKNRDSARSSQPKQDERDYKEEIKTLMIRLDVLESESDNIKEAMDSVKREIKVEHRQVANIEKQEAKIKEEIEELNIKLDGLANHRQDYFDKCEKLEEKYRTQEDKLTMVKDTIRQLNRDVEKIQLSGVVK